jgi:hypothetical protein
MSNAIPPGRMRGDCEVRQVLAAAYLAQCRTRTRRPKISAPEEITRNKVRRSCREDSVTILRMSRTGSLHTISFDAPIQYALI